MLSEENTAKLYHKQGEKKYNSFGEKIKILKKFLSILRYVFLKHNSHLVCKYVRDFIQIKAET